MPDVQRFRPTTRPKRRPPAVRTTDARGDAPADSPEQSEGPIGRLLLGEPLLFPRARARLEGSRILLEAVGELRHVLLELVLLTRRLAEGPEHRRGSRRP